MKNFQDNLTFQVITNDGSVLTFDDDMLSIPAHIAILGLDRKYTPAIVTWLKLRTLCIYTYGGYAKSSIKKMANNVDLTVKTFKKHLEVLTKFDLIRTAQDNPNQIQIVSQTNDKAISVGKIEKKQLFKINNEISYTDFRSFLVEVLIELDFKRKKAIQKAYKKNYGVNSKEFASLTKWIRDCNSKTNPTSLNYVKSITNLSKTTLAKYRKKETPLTVATYSNKITTVKDTSVQMLHELNDAESDKAKSTDMPLKDFGYYFINSRGQLTKRFIAIRQTINSNFVGRHLNGVDKNSRKRTNKNP